MAPFGTDAIVSTWVWRPGWDVVVAVLLVACAVGAVPRAGRGHPVAGWRVACCLLGTFTLLLSVSSGIEVYARHLAYVHMVQHLLLVMVVPALLVLGRAGHLLSGAWRRLGGPVATGRTPLRQVAAVLGHPVVAFCAYAVVIVGTHLTSFMGATASRPVLADVEQVLYVVVGYLFLRPVVGSSSAPPYLARVGLVLVGMVPDTVVGIVLLQTTQVVGHAGAGPRPAGAPGPLEDVHVAGALMWAGGDGLMMLLGVGVVLAMVRDRRPAAVLGQRLEAVRRDHLLGQGGVRAAEGPDADGLDGDDAVLAAYNQMLTRLDGAGRQG